MMITTISCIIVIVAFVEFSSAKNYCDITCPGNNYIQTMCLLKDVHGPSNTCGKVLSVGLTKKERNSIVEEHNTFRKKVADGLETRGNPGGQPPAKNMQTLTWDNELATIAQKWADQCTFDHDKCRDVDRFPVGQNIAISSSSSDDLPSVVSLVQQWENEVEDFDRNEVSKLRRKGFSKVGHYTQMVWAKTSKVGCGMIKYAKDGWNSVFLVCDYGPAGNYFGQPIYETA